jgi:hypothetical protein
VPSTAERNTVLFGGAAGTLLYTVARDDGRRVRDEAKLAFINAANQFLLVDFVLVVSGGDPTNIQAVSTLGAPAATVNYNYLLPGNYDLYTRETATNALLSGPTPLSLAAGGIYGVLALNGADTATTRIVLFDDFQ